MTRILIVEDEKHLADGLRFNLEAEGYQVGLVDTGEAAIEALTKEPDSFDVVVLDVMLPGKDGFEVISEVRHAGQFVPTLMLTARGHPDDVLKGFAAGADDYLAKPFDLAILIARIRGLLRRKEWHSGPRTAPQKKPDVFTFGDKSVDFNRLDFGRHRGGAFDVDGGERTSLPDPARRRTRSPQETAGRRLGPARRHRHARDRQFHCPAQALYRR